MSQTTIWHALECEVRATGNVRAFNAVRSRLGISSDASVADVRAALGPGARGTPYARNRILGAIITEYKHGSKGLWGALLALLFKPSIKATAKGLCDTATDEAQQRVLLAFYEAAAAHRPILSANNALDVIRAMRRLVFRPLAAERDEEEATEEFIDDETQSGRAPSMETLIDGMRIVRRIGAEPPPAQRERRCTYVRRVANESDQIAAVQRRLRHHRVAEFAELHQQIQHQFNA